MERVVHFSKAYHNATTLHPIGAALFFCLAAGMFLLPRRFMGLPIFALVCFVTTAQRVSIAGLDFDLLRLMILVGHFRIFWRSEFLHFRWKPIDIAIVTWGIVGTITYLVSHSDFMDLSQTGVSPLTKAAAVYRSGQLFDQFGLYFLFRLMLRDWEDVEAAIRCLIWVSIPLAFTFLYEKQTEHNPFAIFGGVPEHTLVRSGRARAQGAFSHPIIAGVFFATMLPFVVVRWLKPQGNRREAFFGIFAFLTIVYSCSSSTPIMAIGFALAAAMMYPFRRYLGFFRWSVFGFLVLIHFARDKPVWHLIARVNIIGGTGWHRFHLMDQWIKRWDEWFLFGTKDTVHWGWGLGDVTNEYVAESVRGGFFELLCFMTILLLCFQAIGRLGRLNEPRRYDFFCVWAIGCALFSHVMSFISVSYFGQAKVVWFFLLATISTLSPVPKLKMRRAYSPKIKTKPIDPLAIYAPREAQ
ncbi:MAG: hypothetical protein KDC38_08000 [Planctomycetes bacterium]|nr:hypothetical protein [Planctomycetota bacterium]